MDRLVLCYELDKDLKFYSGKHLTKLKYPHMKIMFTCREYCFKTDGLSEKSYVYYQFTSDL